GGDRRSGRGCGGWREFQRAIDENVGFECVVDPKGQQAGAAGGQGEVGRGGGEPGAVTRGWAKRRQGNPVVVDVGVGVKNGGGSNGRCGFGRGGGSGGRGDD